MTKRAFTLLEIMLVIFLLAVAATFIVPTIMRADNSPAQRAAERFYSQLMQLRNKAQIQGQITGVRVDNRRYRFMQYAQGAWQPVSLPRTATDVALPPSVAIALQHGEFFWQCAQEASRLTLHDIELEVQQSGRSLAPQVWFSPHEPPAPFTLQFRQTQPPACQEVSLRVTGELSLQACPEDNA